MKMFEENFKQKFEPIIINQFEIETKVNSIDLVHRKTRFLGTVPHYSNIFCLVSGMPIFSLVFR